MEIIPTTSIFRHSFKPQYAMMRFWKDNGFSVLQQWGKLEIFTEDDIRKRGLDIILAELQAFADRSAPVVSEVDVTPQEKRRSQRLLNDSDHVTISLHSGSELWIQPIIVTGRGSGRGDPSDRVVLPLPSTNADLMDALNTAFSRCAVIYDR